VTKEEREKVLNRLRAAQQADPHGFGIWVVAASRRWVVAASRRGDWQTLTLVAKALEPQKETVARRLRLAYAKLFHERLGRNSITKADIGRETGLSRQQCAHGWRKAGLDWLPEGKHGRPKKG
jgi:hypothetical protein